MPYRKTLRKNKKPGEYKPRVTKRNNQAKYLMKQLDQQMWTAIALDR